MGTNRLWTAVHPHQEIFNSCTCSNVSKISFIFVWFEDVFSLGQSQVNEGSDFTNKFVFCLRQLDHKNIVNLNIHLHFNVILNIFVAFKVVTKIF